MRTGISAGSTGQAGIQWNTIILIVPCIVDDVEFGNEESFKEKLNTLKESYFPKTTVDRTYSGGN